MKNYLLALLALAVSAFTAPLCAQQTMGAIATPQINSTYYVGSVAGFNSTIQLAVTTACTAGGNREVNIPAGYAGTDLISGVTGGCTNGINGSTTTAYIKDERSVPNACYIWSGSAYTVANCGSSGGSTFSGLAGGTNNTAAMVVGSGAALSASGSGSIAATSVPASGVSGTIGTVNGVPLPAGGSISTPLTCGGSGASCPLQQINPTTGCITTTTAAITAASTTVPVASVTGCTFVPGSVVALQSNSGIEWTACTAVSGSSLTCPTRGFYNAGTNTQYSLAANAWPSGTNVIQMTAGSSVSATAAPYSYALANGAVGWGGSGNITANTSAWATQANFFGGIAGYGTVEWQGGGGASTLYTAQEETLNPYNPGSNCITSGGVHLQAGGSGTSYAWFYGSSNSYCTVAANNGLPPNAYAWVPGSAPSTLPTTGSSPAATLTFAGIFSVANSYQIRNNTVIPSWTSGYQGNSSATDIPMSLPWGTAGTGTLTAVCHDANGNLTDGSCPSGGGGGSGTLTLNGVSIATPTSTGNIAAPIRPNTNLLAQYLLVDCSSGAGATCPDTSGNANNATLGSGSNYPAPISWGLSFTPGNGYSGTVTPQYLNLPTADNSGNLFVIDETAWAGVQDSGATNGGYQWNKYETLLATQGATSSDTLIINGWSQNYVFQGSQYPTMYNISTNTRFTAGAKPFAGHHVLAIYTGAPNRMWLDGTEMAYGFQGSAAIPAVTSPNFWTFGGSVAEGSTFAWQGTLGMVMVYDTSLTGSALDALAKQATSYDVGIVTTRPGFPLYPPGNTGGYDMVWVGDSIGAGLNAGGTTIQQYLALNNTYTIVNESLASLTAHTANVLFPARIVPYISSASYSGSTPNKCIIALGTNDVSGNEIEYPAAATWASNIAMGQQCHAAGGQAILVDMIDRSGEDANKDTLDTLMRNNWKASGAFDAFADVAEVPALGADGASSDPTYFAGDGIHPASAGQQLYAGVVTNAVNYLDGYSASNPHVVSSGASYTMTTADAWLQLGSTVTAVTLPPCSGMTGETYHIFSTAGVTVSNSSDAAAAIVGATAIAATSPAAYMVNLYGGSTAGGCNYMITQ